MKKTLTMLLCGAFCVMVFSCNSTAAAAVAPVEVGPGVPGTGEWVTYTDATNNGGSSVIEAKYAEEVINGEKTEVHNYSGNVTTKYEYGFVGWQLSPDDATLELLKTAKSFSFNVLGDGKKYVFKFVTTDVKDDADFEFVFATEPRQVVRVEIPVRFLGQPSWGTSVRFRQNNVRILNWQTHESWRPSAFQVKFWDFRIHQ